MLLFLFKSFCLTLATCVVSICMLVSMGMWGIPFVVIAFIALVCNPPKLPKLW